jgi:two-component system KDP operon response regulator KdpE
MSAPRPTILVVDDNRGNRHFAQVLLKPEGYSVLQAPNLNEALETLGRERVDLVLADVRMPGGGGFELYASLRGGPHAAIPFLLMSATLGPDLKEQAGRCPGLQLVERPIDADEYVAAIKAALPIKK